MVDLDLMLPPAEEIAKANQGDIGAKAIRWEKCLDPRGFDWWGGVWVDEDGEVRVFWDRESRRFYRWRMDVPDRDGWERSSETDFFELMNGLS